MRLKRILRYLKGAPRVVWVFEWREDPHELSIFTGSELAGSSEPFAARAEESLFWVAICCTTGLGPRLM